MLTTVVVVAVACLLALLVVRCVAAGRDAREAREELDKRLQQLATVAVSGNRTAGRSARLALERSKPMRYLLQAAEGESTAHTR